MKKIKILTGLLIICSVLILTEGAYAIYLPEKEEAKKPEYAPNQIIVKFKPQASEKVISSGYKAETLGIGTIDQLNTKHKVKRIEPVFKALHAKSAPGKLMTAQEQSNITAQKYPQRQKRAPKDAKVPDLENIYILEVGSDVDIMQAINEYKNDPNVEYAEPNYKMRVQMVPNDPYYSTSGSWGQSYDDLWGIKKIQCEQAWDISQGEGAVVAVIDTGVDYNHEDLAANIWVNKDEIPGNGIDDDNNGYIDDVKGWDFVGADSGNPQEDNDPMDGCGHGTHCSGTIAAVGNNSLGVIGIAPRAKIMAVKGLDDGGSGPISSLANCIYYAADNGADVLSNSWGGGKCYVSKLLEDVIAYAYSRGCIIIAAAGNEWRAAMLHQPSGIPHVFTVGASDMDDKPSWFTNTRLGVEISAPGENILSLRAKGTDMYGGGTHIVNEKYYYSSGTSMACPHVAGVAALIVSRNMKDSILWTSDQIISAICSGSDKPVDIMQTYTYGDFYRHEYTAPQYGYGRLNAYKALQETNPRSFPFTIIDSPLHLEAIKGTARFAGTATADMPKRHLEFWWENLQRSPDSGFMQDRISDDVFDSVINGALYEFDTTKLTDGQYHMVSYIEDEISGYQNVQWRSVYIANSEKEGFPIPIFDNYVTGCKPPPRRPLFYDLDKDGGSEILVPTALGINILKGDGIIYKSIEPDGVDILEYTPPSVGDVDGDGSPEIITTAYTSSQDSPFALMIFNSEGILKTRAPLGNFYTLKNFPVLCDLNGNSRLEIVIQGRGPTDASYKSDKLVNLYDGAGNLIRSIVAIGKYDAYDTQLIGCPAVGDIDNDGRPEIVAAGYIGDRKYTGLIMTFSSEGDLKWKKYLPEGDWGYIHCNIMLADINNDRKNEVIFTVNAPLNAYIYIVRSENGEDISSWPIYWTYDEFPILANLDSDPEPEIIYGSESEVQAWNWDGSFVPGWQSIPVSYPTQGDYIPRLTHVVAGDVDDDGQQEVIVGSAAAIYVLDTNGTLLFKKNPGWWTRSYVGISDVDGDGKTELCGVNIANFFFGGFEGIHVWPLLGDGSYDAWPMFQHDAQHTGCYIRPNKPPILNLIGNKTIDEGQALTFIITGQDLDNDPLAYSTSNLPIGATFDPLTTQTFAWTPGYDQAGTYDVTFTVSDGSLQASETITIRVNNVNRPPVLYPIGDKTIERGKTLKFTVSAKDPDMGPLNLSMSAYSLPKGATFKPYLGPQNPEVVVYEFVWTPTLYQVGTYKVTFTVTDGNPSISDSTLSTSETIVITVTNIQPPIAPSDLTAIAISSTQINLKWADKSTNETGFKIERGLGPYSSFTQIAIVGPNVTTYSNKGLASRKTYYYRVRAYNRVGNSAYSNIARATTK